MKPTLAAAMLTLNEEANLRELLPRLDWVDQIVVVDAGSADRTVETARSFGCRVVSRPMTSFASQRNAALDLIDCEWVLSIDADERPTPRLIDEIREKTAHGRAAAYRVPIRSTILGRPFRRCGTQDDRPIRLFRRDSARWEGRVHETLRVSGRVGRLDAWLTHRTQSTLDEFLRKMHRYTRLEAHARTTAGRPPRHRDRWLMPAREVFRRLLYKQGLLDGPAGWTFCLLSGLYEHTLVREHERLWAELATCPPTNETPIAGSRPGLRDCQRE